MPRDPSEVGTPRDGLRRAKSNLARARQPKRNGANVDQPQTFMNPTYTERQGQFLAYIHQYSILNGCAPAEADMQRFFQITPPSVHSMVLTLERRGFIQRVPGQARSITLIVPPESLPPLKRVQPSPFKP